MSELNLAESVSSPRLEDEKRTFKIDPHLIFDVISKQNGTVSKAIMEGVMNSIDAGATQCHVEISQHDFAISDDGRGFTGRQEIERFFETFGTPHKKGDAVFGKFRLGRGAILSFGVNRWRSGAFSMHVDIKNKGLDYSLRETPDDLQSGCSIQVDLYDRLSPTDLDGTLRELKELVAYSPVPVFLNGAEVSKKRSALKWDHEDDKCLIAFRESGSIKLYNLGMYVRSFQPGQYGGRGAIVVSKEQIEVNFARTDVMVNQCEVWKHVRKVLDKYARERGDKKSTRTTNEDRQYAIRQFLSGVMPLHEFRFMKVIPTFPSGYTTLDAIISSCCYKQTPLVVMASDDNERIAEATLRAERARILRAETLDWFGVDEPREMIEAVVEALKKFGDPREGKYLIDRLQKIYPIPLKQASAGIVGSHSIIHSKEWTSLERAMVRGLQAALDSIRGAIATHDELDHYPARRDVRIGLSDSALAWTDGSSFVSFERKFLSTSVQNLAGVGELIGTLVHEMIHDEDDSGSHLHDASFYERFHNLMLGGCLSGQREFLREFLRACRSGKAKIPAGLRRDLDVIFHLSQTEADVGSDDVAQAA